STSTISFNVNGGTGTAPNSMTVTYGQSSAALPDSTGSTAPTGPVVGGWNTQADGKGTNYAAGAVISNVTSDIPLFAKWNTSTSTISFNENGGTGTAPNSLTVTYGQSSAALPDSTGITAPTGKVVGGWNTQADGNGTNYAAGAVISNVTS
uniref:InlB B-repeat-containing protein n=1 Tax=Cohnella mopanensis TaxID=2911966 RepID=UPI001EF92BE5